VRLGKGERYPVVELGREGDEVYGWGRYSRWMILRMNLGTTGAGRKGLDRGACNDARRPPSWEKDFDAWC